jgi:hypothetical protein
MGLMGLTGLMEARDLSLGGRRLIDLMGRSLSGEDRFKVASRVGGASQWLGDESSIRRSSRSADLGNLSIFPLAVRLGASNVARRSVI